MKDTGWCTNDPTARGRGYRQPPEDFAEHTNDPGGPLTADEGRAKRLAAWRAMESIKASPPGAGVIHAPPCVYP